MRNQFSAIAIGLTLITASALPASATEDRCAVVGQIAVSAYLAFFAEFANGRQEKATVEAGRATDVIALFGQLGCDTARLNKAIECLTGRLLDRAPSAPNLIARDCIRDAGLPHL